MTRRGFLSRLSAAAVVASINLGHFLPTQRLAGPSWLVSDVMEEEIDFACKRSVDRTAAILAEEPAEASVLDSNAFSSLYVTSNT